MELSAIVREYDVPLTRSERNLLSQLPSSATVLSGDRYKQQMKALVDARAVIIQLPDRRTTERQHRMEKAAMLKERLKVLRQMMQFLSPSAAKALKTEMKQIAAQLASLDGGTGGSASDVMPTSESAAAEAVSETEPAVYKAESSETDQVDVGATNEQPASPDITLQRLRLKNGYSNSEDRRLKETVEELKILYKAVLAALKRKQQAGRAGSQFGAYTLPLRAYSTMADRTSSVALDV